MKVGELKKKTWTDSPAGRTRSARCFSTIEVCHLFDISKATLYRWEREGLISLPSRDWRNWRLYTTANIEEIKSLIRRRTSN
ncbi:MAG: MerR family transcriptional regulator [Nitrospirae bacterium]|nr:MAG: MerR family transcriptional regulator [Nitrospirota bacterium]